MKIICQSHHKKELEIKLKNYMYLNLVLVEKGMDYQGVAYIFDMQSLDCLEEYLQTIESKKVIYGKIKERIYKIDICNIIYIEGFSKEAYIYTKENQYEVKEKLYELQTKLESYDFVRISKSLIVNCRMIESFEPLMNMKYRLYLKNNMYVDISRSYLKSFKEYLKLR